MLQAQTVLAQVISLVTTHWQRDVSEAEQSEKSAVITKNSQRETSDWQSSMLRHTGGVELTSVLGCFFNLLGG